ncbi:hypothetical protein [Tautonia plasticadhaerens]|uniref:Uncharacterized protein n=1 Tax=Tautonia plasticadhaerens TaxID=2527974 RepID=A0A518HE84_9BACT|nr:hypothetical protein [Tautonia plasticadhaerens]QDV39046.1 hypothetical protein ElP_70080 [Tautonia plasticadhaerens]
MSDRRRHRHRFRPAGVDANGLESRTFLNGSGWFQGVGLGPRAAQLLLDRPVPQGVIGSYTRGVQGRDSVTSRVSDGIDRAFDSFTADYLQAQSAYLASTPPGTPMNALTAARNAFESLTVQRVNLLSQELIQELSRVPGSLQRATGQANTPLQSFLNRRINSPRPMSQSLLSTLLSDTVIPPPGTTGATASLYTLTATNAIEAARVSTANATKFTVSGVFRKHGP